VAKVIAEVVEGVCQGGCHAVGDRWEVSGFTPAGMCLGAFGSLFQYIRVLGCGGSFSWGEDEDTVLISCPDPEGITFKVRRVRDDGR